METEYVLAAVVRAAADGDVAAWRSLVGRFSGLVWAVARGYGLAPADAEDVCQVTWFRFADHIGRIKDPDRVGAWLAATARHEALKVARAAQRVAPIPDLEVLVPEVDDRSPESAVVEAEERTAEVQRLRAVWAAFEQLPERCRRLLRALLASPPPSYAEVAVAFDIPVGSIGPTRARCLRRLRDLLAERGITGVEPGNG